MHSFINSDIELYDDETYLNKANVKHFCKHIMKLQFFFEIFYCYKDTKIHFNIHFLYFTVSTIA